MDETDGADEVGRLMLVLVLVLSEAVLVIGIECASEPTRRDDGFDYEHEHEHEHDAKTVRAEVATRMATTLVFHAEIAAGMATTRVFHAEIAAGIVTPRVFRMKFAAGTETADVGGASAPEVTLNSSVVSAPARSLETNSSVASTAPARVRLETIGNTVKIASMVAMQRVSAEGTARFALATLVSGDFPRRPLLCGP